MSGKYTFSKSGLSKQAGFTVIELIVVVVLLGFLANVAVKSFSSGNVGLIAKTDAMVDAARKLSQNLALLAQAAGTTTDIEYIDIAANGSTTLDVLVQGTSAFNHAKYPNAYVRSGVAPLAGKIQQVGTNYKVAGIDLNGIGGGQNRYYTVYYLRVPSNVVEKLVSKYGSNVLPLLPNGENTHPVVRYSPARIGTHTVTITHHF